jgi:hypothetical protein
MSTLQHFPRITTFLWFDSNAEEAVDFYLTVFKNSRRLDVLRNTDDSRAPNGVSSPLPSSSTARSLPRSTAARCSNSPKPSRLWCGATRSRK